MVKTPNHVRLVALYMAILLFITMCLSGCSSTSPDNTIPDNIKVVTVGSVTTTYLYDERTNYLISVTQVDSNTDVTIKTDYFWKCDNGYILANGSYTIVIDANGNIIPEDYLGGTCDT